MTSRDLFRDLERREGHDDAGYGQRGRKACRVCDDFKNWRKEKSKAESARDEQCPLDREELGRNTWSYLHTMAAYYPEKPTEKHKTNMINFMDLFSQFYPCDICATDLRKNIKKKPPDVRDRYTFSQWMCEQHNAVNKKLGKPKFDCSKVLERWRDGWKDGSCD